MYVMKKERELLRKYSSNIYRELDLMMLDKVTSERYLLPVLRHLEDISNRLFRSDENIRTSIRFSEIDDSTFKEEFNQVEFYRGELIEYRFKCEFFLEDQEKRAYYKAWFNGPNEKLKHKEITSSMKHSKEYWSDPKLDEDLSKNENELEKQEEIEHKNNFRFKQPDQEFIKRYPRAIEESSRGEDNRRKFKKQEVKERKATFQTEKMENLRKLRDIKSEEIEKEMEKLEEITENQEIAFDDEDIEGDFDPEAHDRRMKALFNDVYNKNGPEEDEKPSIDIDDEDAAELQPENHDNWTGDTSEGEQNDTLHCEDDDFNKNAEYDPKATQKEIVDITRWKKKRKRKSKVERSKMKWKKVEIGMKKRRYGYFNIQ